MLQRQLPKVQIEEVESPTELAHKLTQASFDVVLTEHDLGWTDERAIVRSVHEKMQDTPVVCFTRRAASAEAVESMRAGLYHYLVKSSENFLRLPEVVSAAWEEAQTRRRMARSETRLQSLLERSRIGVFRSTLDQQLVEANAAFLRILGVESLEHALDVELPELYFSSEARAELLRQLDDNGELHEREVELQRADGTTIWINLSEILLIDADGDIVIDGLVDDISSLKSREQILRRRVTELERSNEDLQDFASVVAHELQEPLRMVERYTRLLAEDYGDKLDAEGEEFIGFAIGGAERMQGLIEDLLAFSRISTDAQAFRACDCDALVDRAIRNLWPEIEESRAQIRRDALPKVLGDESQLVQLFQNLITNAIKFHGDEIPLVEIGVRQSGRDTVLTVTDNGIGVPSGQLERVFEIFTRLHPEYRGTGVGLALCRRIVERHGGRIWVESEEGKGSAFCFTLPVDREPQNSGATPMARTGPS